MRIFYRTSRPLRFPNCASRVYGVCGVPPLAPPPLAGPGTILSSCVSIRRLVAFISRHLRPGFTLPPPPSSPATVTTSLPLTFGEFFSVRPVSSRAHNTRCIALGVAGNREGRREREREALERARGSIHPFTFSFFYFYRILPLPLVLYLSPSLRPSNPSRCCCVTRV